MPWKVEERNGRFCVIKLADGSTVHCHATMDEARAQVRALYANEGKAVTFIDMDEFKAVWTQAYQDNLPDSSFAYIEPGGSKDGEGKTTPRSLRHFPYKDASGKPDAAHVRNALARIPQSSVSDAAKAAALSKVRAAAKQLGIQVSEDKSLMSDTDAVIYYGGAVKALGDGKVGGYLVEFSDPATKAGSPDLDGDFFAADTDYDLEENKSATVYYDHGRDPVLKRRKLGKVTMRIDDVGVWVEGQLNRRDEHEKAVYRLAELGKLGWSSGTAPHLVDRKSVGSFNKILSWPLGDDASLTPTPASYTKTNQVVALKSASAQTLADAIAAMDKPDEEPTADFPTFSTKALDEALSAAYNDDLETHSLKVATAVEELIAHYAKASTALDVLSGRMERKQEFRFTKDGRAISKRRAEEMLALADLLDKMPPDITGISSKLRGMAKLAQATREQHDALAEAIRLQHNTFQQLKEGANA